jgi:hypothetical protein
MIASGVRSSCDASAVNRLIPSNELSIRANRSLKTRASLPNSSFLFFTGNRSCRFSALIRSARAVISAIGARLLRASR